MFHPHPRLERAPGNLLQQYLKDNRGKVAAANLCLRLRREEGLVPPVDWAREFIRKPELARVAQRHFEKFPLLRRIWMQREPTAVYLVDNLPVLQNEP